MRLFPGFSKINSVQRDSTSNIFASDGAIYAMLPPSASRLNRLAQLDHVFPFSIPCQRLQNCVTQAPCTAQKPDNPLQRHIAASQKFTGIDAMVCMQRCQILKIVHLPLHSMFCKLTGSFLLEVVFFSGCKLLQASQRPCEQP